MDIQTKIAEIFRDVKPFDDENLEKARKSLAKTYAELKKGNVSEESVLASVHADLVAFDIVYERERNRTKNGVRQLPYPEIADFFDRGLILKQFISDLESRINA